MLVKLLAAAAIAGLASGCTSAPTAAQPAAPAQAKPTQSMALDLARHEAGSHHFDNRARRSELIAGGGAAEVSREESLSIMGGEDGVWKDPVVGYASALRFTLGGRPREGALDLSMDPNPGGTLAFSVDNRLGRGILLAPIMIRRDGTKVSAVPGKPCQLNNGTILGEGLPAGVFAVVVPAAPAPVVNAPECGGNHDMFAG